MCLWAADLISFHNLSEQKKKQIRQDLERRQKALKTQLSAVSKVLRQVSQKSKTGSARGRRRRRRG